MKKNSLWKNIIIGKIDKNHPQSEKIDKAVDEISKALDEISRPIDEISKVVDETFTSVGKMTNDIDDKRK